jgi:DNA-binding GntR family transcriptional regulator
VADDIRKKGSAGDQWPEVARSSLTMKVYAELEAALFEGRLHPGQRLKIRDLASAMGVSETPVREAIMQLVRTGALRMETARSITVAGLTLAQYLELRTIRFELEGLAAEAAARLATAAEIDALAEAHERLIEAERAGDAVAANKANWAFHGGLYRAARMPQLMEIISTIWHRNGPMHALHYPDAPPTYPGRHRHLDILDALRAHDPAAARAALKADLVEGGANLVRILEAREAQGASTR